VHIYVYMYIYNLPRVDARNGVLDLCRAYTYVGVYTTYHAHNSALVKDGTRNEGVAVCDVFFLCASL